MVTLYIILTILLISIIVCHCQELISLAKYNSRANINDWGWKCLETGRMRESHKNKKLHLFLGRLRKTMTIVFYRAA